MQNEAQYDLDKKAAKYLHWLLITWVNTVEQAKFEYSPLVSFLIKG